MRLLTVSLVACAVSWAALAWPGGPALAKTPAPAPQAALCSVLPQPGEVAIIGRITATSGRVRIPELGITSPIGNGCFEFRNLTLPRSPMLVSFEIRADGFRPADWRSYLIMFANAGAVTFSPQLHPGSELEVIDPCPYLIAHPQEQSAAVQLHAQLCAELLGVTLPSAGSGPRSDPHLLALLLAVAGSAMLLGGGALALRLSRRAAQD